MTTDERWIGEALTLHDVWQHHVSEVFVHQQTEFQELWVVNSPVYGKALVLDDRWQTCTGDEFLYHEPIIHIPFLLHGEPKRVLIAGGADGGAAREALKWKSIEEVLLVDIDRAAVEACRQWLPEVHQGSLNDPRVKVQIGDAFDVIANSQNWDVIVADLTDPIESGPAYKLFTQEFFQHCRNALNPGGVFVNQAGSLSPPLVGPLARTAKTIGSVFRHATLISANVPTYGSQWGLVVASDRQFDALVDPSRIDQRLADSILGELRSLDGQAVLGHMQSPKYARERIASETVTYTLKNPPQLQRSRETAE